MEGAEGMEVVDEVGEIVMAGEEGEDTKGVEAPFLGRILEEEVDLHQELQGVADLTITEAEAHTRPHLVQVLAQTRQVPQLLCERLPHLQILAQLYKEPGL